MEQILSKLSEIETTARHILEEADLTKQALSENAEQKWYYPTKFKSNAEATVLLKSFQIDDEKKKMLLQQGSQWKQRKMKETAYEIMPLKEYKDFMNTVYPEKGRPDAFARQQAVMNLKNKVENYLKQ